MFILLDDKNHLSYSKLRHWHSNYFAYYFAILKLIFFKHATLTVKCALLCTLLHLASAMNSFEKEECRNIFDYNKTEIFIFLSIEFAELTLKEINDLMDIKNLLVNCCYPLLFLTSV